MRTKGYNKTDKEFGFHFYQTVYDWDQVVNPFLPASESSVIDVIVGEVGSLFSTIYIKEEKLDSSGEPQITYTNVGLSSETLINDFIAYYGDRLISMPYYPESNQGNLYSVGRLVAKANQVLNSNKYKYIKLLATMGFDYNPLENYNGKEEQVSTKGTVTQTKAPTDNKGSELLIQSSQVALGGSGNVASVVTWDNTTAKSTLEIEADNTNKPTTSHYTTTSDDAATGRLEYYDENKGLTTQSTHTQPQAIYREFTDTGYTITTEQSDLNPDTFVMTRSGNLGITSSQQMLEQERQVVKFSIEEEFFNDLAKEILLSTY